MDVGEKVGMKTVKWGCLVGMLGAEFFPKWKKCTPLQPEAIFWGGQSNDEELREELRGGEPWWWEGVGGG